MGTSISSNISTFNLTEQSLRFAVAFSAFKPNAITIDPSSGTVTVQTIQTNRFSSYDEKYRNFDGYYLLLRQFKRFTFYQAEQGTTPGNMERFLKIREIFNDIFLKSPFEWEKESKENKEKWARTITVLKHQFYPLKIVDPEGTVEERQVKEEKQRQELFFRLIQWKKNHPLFLNQTSLNPIEKKQFEQLIKNANVVTQALKDSTYAYYLFEQIIKNNFNIDLVVNHPLVIKKFKSHNMLGAFARGGQKVIRVTPNKTVEIKVCGQWKTVHSDQSIELPEIVATGWKVQDIYDDGKKNFSKGNSKWTCFPEQLGYVPWNPMKLGWVNPNGKETLVPIDSKNFFTHLPIYECLSFDELKKRYGENVEEGKNHYVVRSSCKHIDPDIEGSHGFFDFVLYQPETHQYSVYPMGAYAKQWPNLKSIKETFLFFTGSVKGTMAFPDSNDQNESRLQYFEAYPLSQEGSDAIQTMIYKMMVESRQDRLLFQIAQNNCMKKVEDLYNGARKILTAQGCREEDLKNHLGSSKPLDASMSLLDLKPKNILFRKLIQIGRLSKNPAIQLICVRAFLLLFGFFRRSNFETTDSQGKKKIMKISIVSQQSKLWQGIATIPSKLIVEALKGNQPNARLYFGSSGKSLTMNAAAA